MSLHSAPIWLGFARQLEAAVWAGIEYPSFLMVSHILQSLFIQIPVLSYSKLSPSALNQVEIWKQKSEIIYWKYTQNGAACRSNK